jgi:hypothetical protein
MPIKRSRRVQETLSTDNARWAYQIAVTRAGYERWISVDDETIELTETTREAVEALIDSLAADGCLRVLRSVGVEKSRFMIDHP